MAAEVLLDEIHSESLQNLLTAVAFETSPPGSTHIDALDAHISTTGHRSSLNRGDLIEIQGPAASGKTHLLYHLIITCLMPYSHPSAKLEGWNKAAVVFDTDGTFDVNRLRQLFISRLFHLATKHGDFLPGSQADEICMHSLEKLHVFRPTSSTQLATSLCNLQNFHATHLAHAEIGLLAIDSISSFYWLDRFTVEQMRSGSQSACDSRIPAYTGPLYHILAALQKFRHSHGPVIVVTNWGLNALPDSPFYKQHLQPFLATSIGDSVTENTKTEFVFSVGLSAYDSSHTLVPLTHHITLPFVPITQLQPSMHPAGTTSKEEEIRRNKILDDGQVMGIVRTVGNSRMGRFSFQIRETEIVVGRRGNTP